MAVKLSEAKALCSKSELALVRSSTRLEIGKLSPAQLKQAATRAKRLHDKWAGQLREQNRKAKSNTDARRVAENQRTADKVRLFAEVLEAFQARLAAQAGPKPAAKPATAAPAKRVAAAKPPAAKGSGRKKASPTSLAIPFAASAAPGIPFNPVGQLKARTAAKQFQFKIGHLQRTQRHRQAVNKRNQARRDARGGR